MKTNYYGDEELNKAADELNWASAKIKCRLDKLPIEEIDRIEEKAFKGNLPSDDAILDYIDELPHIKKLNEVLDEPWNNSKSLYGLEKLQDVINNCEKILKELKVSDSVVENSLNKCMTIISLTNEIKDYEVFE